jgi:hypothetical protein
MSHKMLIFKAGIDFVLVSSPPPPIPKNQFNDGMVITKNRFCGGIDALGHKKFKFGLRNTPLITITFIHQFYPREQVDNCMQYKKNIKIYQKIHINCYEGLTVLKI